MLNVQGYQLQLDCISHLSQEDYRYLTAKMSVFAISLDSVSANPLLVKPESITAYYAREDLAQATKQAILDRLHKIRMEHKVCVSLVAMQLSLSWDEVRLLARDGQGEQSPCPDQETQALLHSDSL